MDRGKWIGVVALLAIIACNDGTGPTAPVTTTPPQTPTEPATPAPVPQRSAHFVAVSGRSSNAGDADAPWDLATALSGASGRVTAGDTVWVRGGIYRGTYLSTLTGTASAPVIVRAVPGERAILSHEGSSRNTLSIHGAYVTIWGLEVTNDDPDRLSPVTASEWRPNGVVNSAHHARYVQMVVHDAGVGFYNYPSAHDVEITGSLFYNNGWQGPDRGHGHAIYIKSDEGPVTVRHNVIFNQFGWGVHAYADAGSGRLNRIVVEENAVMNSGALASSPSGQNILLGGETTSDGSRIVRNLTWLPSSASRANAQLGYGSTMNGSVLAEDNTFIGGDPVLRVGRWSAPTMRTNLLVGDGQLALLDDPSILGVDLGGLLGLSTPSSSEVHVWTDADQPGRAIAVVLNWSSAGSVAIPLTDVLAAGEAFEVRNAQDPFAAVIASGTSSGSVTVPMSGVYAPLPVGSPAVRAPRTGPEFEVFLIVRK